MGWGAAAGIKQVEAKGAAKHLTVHRTVPTTKKNPAQVVRHEDTEKPCLEGTAPPVETEDPVSGRQKEGL